MRRPGTICTLPEGGAVQKTRAGPHAWWLVWIQAFLPGAFQR